MKKWLLCLLLLCFTPCALAELTVDMMPLDGGPNSIVLLNVMDADENAECASDACEALRALIAERFCETDAQRIFTRAAARSSEEMTISQQFMMVRRDSLYSLCLVWNGEQPEGMDRQVIRTLNFDESTASELMMADLFTDSEGAVSYMTGQIENRIMPELSDYLVYAELLPLPTDNWYMDEYGLTLCYDAVSYRYFDESCGRVQFAWYELAPYIGEESPVHAWVTDAVDHDLKACAEDGVFPAAMSGRLGDPLGEAAAGTTLLDDPDLTDTTRLYQFRDASLRGFALETPKYAEGDAQEAPVIAMRSSRIAFGNIRTNESTKDACISELGEPDTVREIGENAAERRMLTPGESLFWRTGEHALELHFDGENVLRTIILHVSMPE